ncbi:MAG: sensor histidine kinase [Lachnospiraceae bacterium]
MFKKTKRRIIAAIMSILVLLWVGTLGIIYTSSYVKMSRQNQQMLKAHSDMYVLSQETDSNASPRMLMPNGDKKGPNPGFADSPMFRLSTFFTVALSYNGDILEIKNDSPTVYSNDELSELAQQIAKSGKQNGTRQDLVFYCADKNGYTLVSFMDNTVVNDRAATLFRYTLIFGGIALILFYFLSVFLAGKILQPLEESYQKQKQFISDAGHELKTPVSIVSANAELLSRELGHNKWLANIQYENQRMGNLVGQLLDLARTENVTPQMEPLDFSRLVRGESLPFESFAYEKGLVLNSNIAAGISVRGNSTQLKQIVSILLDNAIRYNNGGNEIRLSLTRNHGFAKLSVINRGEDIPEEQREQLFERFYRADAARNSEENHYGLGLSIAKAITVSHKGRIDVLCYDGLVEFLFRIPAL